MANDKNKLNVAPVISPDILKTISAATAIKTFGAQLVNKNKETLVVGNQTKTNQINNELQALDLQEQKAGETQKSTIEKAQKDYNTNQITQKQYNEIKIQAQIAYEKEIASINLKRAKLQLDKNLIENNPYNRIKQNQKGFKLSLKNLKKKTQNEETKSNRDLAKQVALNVSKTLAPVVALQLANQLFKVINQRKKLEDLVEQVNSYINTQVKDEQTVVIATNLRNNAVRLIDNNTKKLENLKKSIEKIVKNIAILTAIILVIQKILSLPFPFLIPIKINLQPKLQSTVTLIAALSAVLVIASNLLGNEIIKLIELKDRLQEISLKLDGKTLGNLNDKQFAELTDFFTPAGINDFPPYKGFNFKIKVEENKSFEVKGNKRRYAVAINRDGVEQIKSDYSFTLDPNDLIEQLKLVIDQRNLQG
jgi:uncharacterized membrane protein